MGQRLVENTDEMGLKLFGKKEMKWVKEWLKIQTKCIEKWLKFTDEMG